MNLGSGRDARASADSSGARASRPHWEPKGWHHRGYLPHLDDPTLFQSITFRLADSLPQSVIEGLDKASTPERVASIEGELDRNYGSCLLKDPEIGGLVEQALLHFDGDRYRLLTWTVMPNHVHALIQPRSDHALSDIIHSWKSFTAKRINALTGATGRIWQPEYFDRFMRDEDHLYRTVEYIEMNPVRAGLVRHSEDWPFGSARLRLREDAGGTPALRKIMLSGSAGVPPAKD